MNERSAKHNVIEGVVRKEKWFVYLCFIQYYDNVRRLVHPTSAALRN